MEGNVFSVAVASLLHDIGKFAQRADKKEFYRKEDEGLALPVAEGGHYSHLHALYTLGFLEKHLGETFDFDIDPCVIARNAAFHHKPETDIQKCITLGDWAASGIDRSMQENECLDKQFYEIPIVSVFSLIHENKEQKGILKYLPLAALDDPVPEATDSTLKLHHEDYTSLWERFFSDWKRLSVHTSMEQYLINLDSLLERWTSFIPSATYKTEPDVSLYDHSRVTAALAVCAYQYQRDLADFSDASIFSQNDPKWLFVLGDVQGIQKYIFSIEQTKNSSKLLRARSYQIEALCRSSAMTIMSECGVVPQCEIMNGGGNFILILPNTPYTKQVLTTYERDINTYLLKEYLGMLSLTLSWTTEVTFAEFRQNCTVALLESIYNANFEAKKHRFHSAIEAAESNRIDFYYDQTAGNEPCTFCGYRPAEIILDDDNNQGRQNIASGKCVHCRDLLEKARRLTSDRWRIVKEFHPKGQMKSIPDFCCFPSSEMPHGKGLLFAVNNYRGVDGSFSAFYPEPYSVPYADNGVPLSFEEIAKNASGIQKIAMFKADVDNLGLIFKSGMGEKISLSKLASLSRQMHYFFSVKLNHFIEENYQKAIYTVFSGGDDICVIGPWDVIFDFAEGIHSEFGKFTLRNPAVTISAGIALADCTTPVPYMAEEASNQLEASKNHPGKNAITLFNTTVSWEEFSELHKKGEKFALDIKNGIISTSFMRRILELGNRAEAFQKGEISPANALWLSHLKYSLTRIKERNSKSVPAKYWDDLLEFLLADKYSMIWKSRISACYALYKNRNSE